MVLIEITTLSGVSKGQQLVLVPGTSPTWYKYSCSFDKFGIARFSRILSVSNQYVCDERSMFNRCHLAHCEVDNIKFRNLWRAK